MIFFCSCSHVFYVKLLCSERKCSLSLYLKNWQVDLTDGQRFWYTRKQSKHGTIKRDSPSRTSCIPAHLARYSKTASPGYSLTWPFLREFMQLGTLTGEPSLDKNQACLLLALKAVTSRVQWSSVATQAHCMQGIHLGHTEYCHGTQGKGS